MRACIKVKGAENLWFMKTREAARGALAGLLNHEHGKEDDY